MRLIDGDALVESIKEELWHWDTVDGINAITVIKQTISDINNMPTIPQPEIIRCRDCKFFSHGYCRFHDAKFVRPDGYCYWGEQKEGEQHD